MEKERDFKVGNIVKVVEFLYFYKEMSWLSVDSVGTVEKILPTNNRHGYQRLEIRFWGNLKPDGRVELFPSNDTEKRQVRLYSAEITHFCDENNIIKIFERECDLDMIENQNSLDLINRFYKVSTLNIERKYQDLIENVKENDKVISKITNTKKDLVEFLNAHNVNTENLMVEISSTDSNFELLSLDSKDKIKELNEKKENEILELKEFCNNASVIVGVADSFDDIMNVLVNHGIVLEDFTLNTEFGKNEN